MRNEHTKAEGSKRENLLVEFTFGNYTVRTVIKNDEVSFVGPAVCEVLDLKNRSQVIVPRDVDKKGVYIMPTLSDAKAGYGAEPEMIYVLGGSLALAGLAFVLLMAFAA